MSDNNQQYYLRWTRNERYQHWILALSFTVLAITGFALKYPEAAWVQPLLFLEGKFDLRGWVHRLAALAFVGLGAYHLGYLSFTPRGRAQFRALLPVRQDFSDFTMNFRFLLGRREEPPDFDHFSYMEKLEYWALAWGTLVMAFTGFLLWFESFALRLFPLWMIEIFTVIHLYEAWLATLAIIVWHFYAVIFNPEVYPLNQSMIDGKISEAEMQREHGRELERLQLALSETEEAVSEPEATTAS